MSRDASAIRVRVVCTSAVRFRKTFAAFAGSDGQKLDSERGIAHGSDRE